MLDEKQIRWIERKTNQLLSMYHPGMKDEDWDNVIAFADAVVKDSKKHPDVTQIMVNNLRYLEQRDRVLCSIFVPHAKEKEAER